MLREVANPINSFDLQVRHQAELVILGSAFVLYMRLSLLIPRDLLIFLSVK